MVILLQTITIISAFEKPLSANLWGSAPLSTVSLKHLEHDYSITLQLCLFLSLFPTSLSSNLNLHSQFTAVHKQINASLIHSIATETRTGKMYEFSETTPRHKRINL